MALTAAFIQMAAELVVIVILGLIGYAAVLRRTAVRRDPRFEPTQNDNLAQVIRELDIQASDIVYDLGCGNGKVLFAAYRTEPRARYVGVEYALSLYLWLCIRKLILGNPSNVTFLKEDLLQADFHSATKIYTYLSKPMMALLLPKCIAQLKGTLIVSFAHQFPPEKPAQKILTLRNSQYGQQTLCTYYF